MAVTCGTPTPATTRVVQMLPGPNADLHGVRARLGKCQCRLTSGDVPPDHVDRGLA